MLLFALVCASRLSSVTTTVPLPVNNAFDRALPITEVAMVLERIDVLETDVLPIAPVPFTLDGKPAAIGVRRLAAAANLDEGLLIDDEEPERPVPTPPTRELVVELIPLAVEETVLLRKGLTVETRSVNDSVIAPTASVAVEGWFEEARGGEEMEVTTPWALVTGAERYEGDDVWLWKKELLLWRLSPLAAPLDRILLSKMCCFIAEGVMGGSTVALELPPPLIKFAILDVEIASERRLA
jgi:hypothetical protein